MLESVDVSWPQGNYHPGAEAGVFVAATSGDGGTNFVQDTLAEDVANARAAGKEVAFYHFNGPEALDPVASARFFWAAIKPYFRDGDLTALDVESSSGGKVPHVSPGWALAFQTEVARLRGLSTQAARVGTYGNRSDMRQPGWGAVEASGSWLWLAAPGGYPENTPVGEWSHWTMLQYSSAGGIDRDQSQLSFSQIAGATTQGDDELSAADVKTITDFIDQRVAASEQRNRRESRARVYQRHELPGAPLWVAGPTFVPRALQQNTPERYDQACLQGDTLLVDPGDFDRPQPISEVAWKLLVEEHDNFRNAIADAVAAKLASK